MVKKIVKQINSNTQQILAWFLLTNFILVQISPIYANPSYQRNKDLAIINTPPSYELNETLGDQNNMVFTNAIPGGPDQPEVQSFSPIGTSDMVDPFTGDFSYNIPLIDVDGFPINLAYEGSPSMDEEASWVGLGWNLNPGVVNRAMRGLPDDFDGSDKITKEIGMKKNFTFGLNVGAGVELVSFDVKLAEKLIQDNGGVNLNVGLGINYNNYNGFGSEFSIGSSLNFAKPNKPGLNAGLGLSGSSTGGANISPSLSFSTKVSTEEKTCFGLNIGSSFNSRAGMQQVSFKASAQKKQVKTSTNTDTGISTEAVTATGSSRSAGASFNLGQTTFMPSMQNEMSSVGGTGSVKIGTTIIGLTGSIDISFNYSEQKIKNNIQIHPAYGYMYAHLGQFNRKALMDFNREQDGPFTKHTPVIGIPVVTSDFFNVSANGIGGSYRIQRPEVGFVFDHDFKSTSSSGSLGFELGAGALAKSGVDLAGGYDESKVGPWLTNNSVTNYLKFKPSIITYRDANEMSLTSDIELFDKIGKDNPVRFELNSPESLENKLVTHEENTLPSVSSYSKSTQEKRNKLLYSLTVNQVKSGMGIESIPEQLCACAKDNHIGQFTALNDQGVRYVYGLPAYNIQQKDVSFSVDASYADDQGLTSYSLDNVSTNNPAGKDGYYSNSKTGPYAHSFLLTSILNPDYVDADEIKGPSEGDNGGYVKFKYKKIDSFQWKTPSHNTSQKANFDEGLNSINEDNKAHYSYGEKELYYVEKIETKNHYVLFYTSQRFDGRSITGEHGALSNSSINAMQKLDSIVLFSIADVKQNGIQNAVAIKTVHFRYDYSLCGNYIQHVNSGINPKGKLTLKKVFFTYQYNDKGRYTPYEFVYDFNPDYNLKNIDRWGTYKPNLSTVNNLPINDLELRNSDFPYSDQDTNSANLNASAWCLTQIKLPSGGKINIDYEADDYQYVQHKKAQRMFLIEGVENLNEDDIIVGNGISVPISDDIKKNSNIYFKFVNPDDQISDYCKVGDLIYFRALMDFKDGKYDFVPGYAKIVQATKKYIAGTYYGLIKLDAAKLMDNGSKIYNPITVAAIQFARLQLSKYIPPSSQQDDPNLGGELIGLANSLAGSVASLAELFVGPNLPVYNHDIGTKIVLGKSWIRLNNPEDRKIGGGNRVRSIKISDNWGEMGGDQTLVDDPGKLSFDYGQEYIYTMNGERSGPSSGVASYEPQLGGDENPWKKPVFYSEELLLAPDNQNYQEEPFGETFFPSPSVGYQLVTVKNLGRTGVKTTATGKVVHEFYTARQFPTIVKRTGAKPLNKKSNLNALFFTNSNEKLGVSQGFYVEKNNMHGKPKAQKVYNEFGALVSKVEYEYLSENKVIEGIASNHLLNEVKVIDKNGSTSTKTIGLFVDAFGDFRESTTNNKSGSVNINLDIFPFAIPIPMIPVTASTEKTAFRSASFVKVVDRFGILSNTIATDLGSEVSTKNLAYDAETGAVLLTETITNFDDKVYNMTFPAHWYYEGMGQAYKNIDLSKSGTYEFINGTCNTLNKSHGFYRGDEIFIKIIDNNTNISSTKIAWVVEVTDAYIKVLNKAGDPINASVKFIKVLRSGRRNMQTAPMQTVTLRENPLNGLSSNLFDKVLQASAIEYTEDWRTFCECYLDPLHPNFTQNDYVKGTKGLWRPKANFVHLTDRSQTYENFNSNIRVDGMFTSFTPLYRLKNNKWDLDFQNWTTVSTITEFSPNGQSIESVDPLNRYSATTFGYNQTLASAVGTNTQYKQIGFDGFEDYFFEDCSDDHFKIAENINLLTNRAAHTGKYSLVVPSGIEGVSFVSPLYEEECDKEPECNMDYILTDKSIYSADFNLLNYQEPLEIEILEKSLNVVLQQNNSTFHVYNLPVVSPVGPLLGPWKIVLAITDANNCKKIIEVKFPN